MNSFDIAFLKSFVAINEAGTVNRAAQQVARTPGALSQQMKVLESRLGQVLFVRRGVNIVPTDAAKLLLPYARQMIALNDEAISRLQGSAQSPTVRLGMPQDFAESILARALRKYQHSQPHVLVQAHVERNSTILQMLKEHRLDIGMVISPAVHEGTKDLAKVESVWLGTEGFKAPKNAPLPLILLDEPCVFRRYATLALEAKGIAWRLVFASPSVSGMWAAVAAGLGITARMPLGLPKGIDVYRDKALPNRLGAVHLGLSSASRQPSAATNALAKAVEGTLADVIAKASNAAKG
jgi:DNA-binding transcriptional LysR family regulator